MAKVNLAQANMVGYIFEALAYGEPSVSVTLGTCIDRQMSS